LEDGPSFEQHILSGSRYAARDQFYQHFTSAFAKKFKPKTQLCNFWRQNIGARCARKMLMKLTPGANFTNVLQAQAAFTTLADSKSPKRHC